MGLAATGSGPVIAVGFAALFLLVAIRFAVLSAPSKKKEGPMKPAKTKLRLLGISALDTFWAVGTSAIPSTCIHSAVKSIEIMHSF